MSDFISVLDGRYQLIEPIGAGGSSEVWHGLDQVLDRPVAVKLLHGGYAAHEEILSRFRAEARHAGLVSHENVARIYDYCDPDPFHPPYLVMELVGGESLAQELEREGALGAERTLDLLAQAAAGLRAAHEAGLIHRDVKPENLLLDESGTVKITDFGISQAAGSVPLTRTGMIVGSPGYLAPERACGARATAASDLYALGVVAYECLSGTRPFTGTELEVVLAHRERPLPPLPPSVLPGLAVLVAELTAKDPGDRPASAAEVVSRVCELRGEPAVPGTATLVDRPAGAGVAQPGLRAASLDWLGHKLAERRPGTRSGHWRRLAGKRYAIGFGAGVATVLVGMIALSVLGTVIRHPGGTAAGPSGPTMRPGKVSPATAARVNVDRLALIGEPIEAARTRLERHHLTVLVRWRPTAAQPPGRVVAVDPAGQLPAGTVITLTAARAPSVRPAGRGKGHGAHHHGPPPGHDHGGGDGPPGHLGDN